MDKIVVLAGKTMSGKTTICNILEKEYNIKRVISFTSRPIRKDEVDGKDYNFYNLNEAQFLILSGRSVASRSYQPHIDFGPYPWYYGFELSHILKEEKPFLITDFKGIIDLKKEFGDEKVFSIYLDISEAEQLKRLKNRDENLQSEQKRRIESDKKDFEGIENVADHIIKISNKKPETLAKEIAKLIEKNS